MAEATTPAKTPLDIPPPYRQLFAQYTQFNAVQSALLDELLHSDRSVVLSAPTGAGKTVAFELALVRLLQTAAHPPPKAVYVAPIKALCSERFDDWQQRLRPLGVACIQITGDTQLVDLQATALRGAQLVVTTPEKWDSLTRRWRDFAEVVGAVRLFMIDEVHLLNEDGRGPILEAIVARMRTIARAVHSSSDGGCAEKALRFVVASATIPNAEDLTAWIGGGGDCKSDKVAQLVFSDSLRPCPLEKHIVGFNSRSKGFQFDMSLNYKLPEILRKYAERKPTLVFCNSRKAAEMAATALAREDTAGIFRWSAEQQQQLLTQHVQRLQDIKLRRLIAHGVAFHHAGMTYDDRQLIEELFRRGLLLVLLSTNTLAMGVNLPAHLVVIKSTESYCRGKYEEYAESTLLQMIGRAGRPQYDTKGVAVILTHSRNVRKYENLMNGKQLVESHLHKHLAEHLNSEIALNTINSLEVAMNWIRSTYLYVRSVRNPVKYGLDANMDKDIVESKLEEMCLVQINALHSAGLITRNIANGLDVQTTAYGKLMAKYYLSFETMKLFRQIRGNESLLEILNLIMRCKEFAEFTLRVNEKKFLNELNSSPIRFPIRGRIKSQEDKISCLIQSVLGNVPISPPGLMQESTKMLRIADRVAKCLLGYLRLSENHHSTLVLAGLDSTAAAIKEEATLGSYKALLHAVTIAKCFHAKLWENSEYAAKQLRKIGVVYSSLLVSAGKTSLKSIATTDARTIELILNKSAPFGDEVLQHLQTFPEYSLQFSTRSVDMVHVYVRQVNEAFVFNGTNAVLIVGDSANHLLFFQENLDSILFEYGFLERTIKLPNPEVEQINAHIIHTTLVGVDQEASIINNIRPQEDKSKIVTKRTATKRKRQTTLDVSLVKKSKYPNASVVVEKNNDVSAIPDDSFLLNLNKFCYSKLKLGNSSIKNGVDASSKSIVNNQPMVLLDDTLPDQKLILDAVNRSSNTQANNTTTRLQQTRLTDYYQNQKEDTFNYIISQDMSADISKDITIYTANNAKPFNTTLDITMPNQGDIAKNISMNISKTLSANISKGTSMDLINISQNIMNDRIETESATNKTLSTVALMHSCQDMSRNILPHISIDIPNNISSDIVMISPKCMTKDISLKSTMDISKFTQDISINTSSDFLMPYKPNDLSTTSLYKNKFTNLTTHKQQSWPTVSVYANTHHFLRPSEMLDLSTVRQNLQALDLSKNSKRQMQENTVKYIEEPEANNSVLDFSFNKSKKSRDFNLSIAMVHNKYIPSVPSCYTPTAVVVPTQKTTNGPSTECYRVWFKVAMSFQKLKPAEQNLTSFIKIYETLNPNPNELQQRKRGRHHPTALPNYKHRLLTSHKGFNNTTATSTTTSTASTVNRHKNKENTNIKSSVPPTSFSRINPFRLRLFEHKTNDSSNATLDLSRSRIECLNARVMQDVLKIKCEQNNEISEDTLSETERELLQDIELSPEYQQHSNTFEEYFRKYMQNYPKPK